MERNGAGPSQLSGSISSVGSSGVLDLSCTYDITDKILQQETPCELLESSLSSLLPSASSLPLMENAGSQANICDDKDKLQRTSCKQTSFATEPQIGDALSSSDLINYESPLKSENESMTDDAQIRKTLDAFYELGNRREFHRSDKNEMLHQLSMRISETNASGSLYALRCLQLAKVIVTQGETDIFQNKAQDSVFSSPACNEIATDNKSIPGLSEDVRRYIVNYNKK